MNKNTDRTRAIVILGTGSYSQTENGITININLNYEKILLGRHVQRGNEVIPGRTKTLSIAEFSQSHLSITLGDQ